MLCGQMSRGRPAGMRSEADEYPEYIERAIQALLSGGVDAGAAALEPIAYPPQVLPRRRSLSRAQMVRIFRRDSFLCRYCGGKTVITSVMELLGGIYPELFPFQSSAWKAGVTHPAVVTRSPAVDHVVPAAHGGTDDDANLVTACTPCNSIKSDFTLDQLGWELLSVTEDPWDGLSTYYRALWKMAGQPKPNYHGAWMTALGV